MAVTASEVNALLEQIQRGPEVYRPSPFWRELVAWGMSQLEGSGFENFKRTVNMSYFSWDVLGILRQQFPPVLLEWVRRPEWRVFRARFPNHRTDLPGARRYRSLPGHRVRTPEVASFGLPAAFVYKLYVAMLWELVSAHDPRGLLRALEEPRLGNPFVVLYRGRSISQDLCNSVHEFYGAEGDAGRDDHPWNVAELGAGYGRVAYVFLKALPACTYCIIDIPPALNIAQEYLAGLFPDAPMFRVRHFDSYREVAAEFESARIRFLAPHQIELLPPKQFDRFLNISSLHEMTGPQIENYLVQIDRLCRGRFYTKQWRVFRSEVNRTLITERDYPIPAAWRCVYHRRHSIQRLFFEALYHIGS